MTSSPDERIPVLGLSDPLNAPTGFGRVSRELFMRLPQDRFRLGFVSQWVGSRAFPGVTTYGDPGSRFACSGFPTAAVDFAGFGRFVLWTLLDPWMTSWLSHPRTSTLGTANSRRFFLEDGGRERFVWVGHFPIDGQGPRAGPGRWVEEYLEAMDVPVAMSDWGRRMVQPWVKKEVRFVSHAVHDGFRPMARDQARREAELSFFRGMLLAVSAERKVPVDDAIPQEAIEEARRRAFVFGDRFTVICAMANRQRKYWPDALRAFKLLLEDVPDARFVGICGDRTGIGGEDQWALEDICRDLGLRLDDESEEPNVWLIELVADRIGTEPDYSMRLLYCAADVALLLSGGEGFGLPQLEAHACGVPCIVGDYTASTELAVDKQELLEPFAWTEMPQNQIRRPIYRPRDVAQRLKWAAKNPGWRKETGAAGVEQAKGRRWDVILPRWVDVLAQAGAQIGPDGEAKPDGIPEAPAPAASAAPA